MRARAATAAPHVRPHVIAPRSNATPLSPGMKGAARGAPYAGFHQVSVPQAFSPPAAARAPAHCVCVLGRLHVFSVSMLHSGALRPVRTRCPRATQGGLPASFAVYFPSKFRACASGSTVGGRATYRAIPGHTRTCPASSPPGVGASQRRRAAPLECTRFEAGVTSTARSRF